MCDITTGAGKPCRRSPRFMVNGAVYPQDLGPNGAYGREASPAGRSVLTCAPHLAAGIDRINALPIRTGAPVTVVRIPLPKAPTWANGHGVWHVQVSRDAVAPLIAARRGLSDALDGQRGTETINPRRWRYPVRVRHLETPTTLVYRELYADEPMPTYTEPTTEPTEETVPMSDDITTYKVMRFYQSDDKETEVLATGLTLEEAQAHCKDPETSSSSATSPEAAARTARYGPWFDGFGEE
jgi:hypothetical protein